MGTIRERLGPEDQGEMLEERNKLSLALPGVNVGVANTLSSFKSQCLLELIGPGIVFRMETSRLLLSEPEQPLLLSCHFFLCR